MKERWKWPLVLGIALTLALGVGISRAADQFGFDLRWATASLSLLVAIGHGYRRNWFLSAGFLVNTLLWVIFAVRS